MTPVRLVVWAFAQAPWDRWHWVLFKCFSCHTRRSVRVFEAILAGGAVGMNAPLLQVDSVFAAPRRNRWCQFGLRAQHLASDRPVYGCFPRTPCRARVSVAARFNTEPNLFEDHPSCETLIETKTSDFDGRQTFRFCSLPRPLRPAGAASCRLSLVNSLAAIRPAPFLLLGGRHVRYALVLAQALAQIGFGAIR